MHGSLIIWLAKNLTKEDTAGKRIIDIGSGWDMTAKFIAAQWKPSEYIGVDISKDRNVDVICSAENLLSRFDKESFDTVISLEVIEHVRDWRKAISNMKNICKPGGIMIITTRSKGYPFHPCPHDFWRYEEEDMKRIFSDCDILVLEKDSEVDGIFMKARKPKSFKENDLKHSLYSILLDRRVDSITDNEIFKAVMSRQKIRKYLSFNINKYSWIHAFWRMVRNGH